MYVTKRDGRMVEFNNMRIHDALYAAFEASNEITDETIEIIRQIVDSVEDMVYRSGGSGVSVETIQELVENELMDYPKYKDVAKAYIRYRFDRNKIRESSSNLMDILKEINTLDSCDSDLKRDNGNVNGDTAMGSMLQMGSSASKAYTISSVLPNEFAKAHESGLIHIADLDFYNLTTTCCQIDIDKLLKDGFSTGHGHLREPSAIRTAAALVCIAIQGNQNDHHGGQSIPNFDHALVPYLKKTYKKNFLNNLRKYLEWNPPIDVYLNRDALIEYISISESTVIPDIDSKDWTSQMDKLYHIIRHNYEANNYLPKETVEYISDPSFWKRYMKDMYNNIMKFSIDETEKECYQSMEAIIHNLNTMHSRAGAQVPFSSLNYGTNTTPEGRMIIKNILLATEAGLGHGETPVFPIQVFRVKDGINFNPGDPNYDLFKLALRVTSKRLFPTFVFQDATFNIQYYDPSDLRTEISVMGCRTRVMSNINGPEISYSRGNLSFCSINLVRICIDTMNELGLGIMNMSMYSPSDIDRIHLYLKKNITKVIDLCIEQLLYRFEIQGRKRVLNYPMLMKQGIWLDSDKLENDDFVHEVLKHGSMAVGFIGLAEAMSAIFGLHHAESPEVQLSALSVVQMMRDHLDEATKIHSLNFGLLATPAEGLSGRFVKIDARRYGIIPGVTDKSYYTNSFHVPVGYNISIADKIKIEAPYHEMCNAGHISYIEIDGDASQNLEALEDIVRAMKEADMGYGAINHPVDRDPICGYSGTIEDTCPNCGRKEDLVPFDRMRRITGYLIGTLNMWNDAKRSEEKDRIKHGR